MILVCLLAIPAVITADAQSYTGSLTLNPISSQIATGNTVVFSGQLTTTSGHVVPDATIYIKDNVRFGSDDVIRIVTTNANGEFYTTWTAQTRSSGNYDFYAIFEGSYYVSKTKSSEYSVRVSSNTSYGSQYNSQSNNIASTMINFNTIPSFSNAGDIVTFTGTLTSNGHPLQNALVKIFEDDPGPDQRLSSTITDSSGRFSVTWIVKSGLVEKDFDIYAVFDGDSNYNRARSPNQTMTIEKHGGSLTLDSIPSSARIGEQIIFTGTLRLDSISPEGAIVYIKDEDSFGRDDLLATGYVGKDGRFSANWVVRDIDPDVTADIFAVFEGNDVLERLTTCGSFCNDTVKLRIFPHISPPIPPNSDLQKGEYMELFYALNLQDTVRVSIILDPDRPNDVRKHIVPVQEGIMMWTSDLEDYYGGNWNVDFKVIRPGDFDRSNPDIILNLVTRGDENKNNGCNDGSDTYGWAWISNQPTLPVNTVVCSHVGGTQVRDGIVSTTSAHEFIHAMGLGHTFNRNNDLMCSVEETGPTCSNTWNKSKTPSALNLNAVAAIYGSDGFQTPNNYVGYRSVFKLDNSNNVNNYNTNNENNYNTNNENNYNTNNEYDLNSALEKYYNSIKENSNNESNYNQINIQPESNEYCEQIYTYDWSISESLDPDWYTQWMICSNNISYSFATDSEYNGFHLFILPPETNVDDFINYGTGQYYTCEEYETSWHEKSNTCYITPGSHIVLHNISDNAIRVNGWIANQ